jgi:hypothetical protein
MLRRIVEFRSAAGASIVMGAVREGSGPGSCYDQAHDSAPENGLLLSALDRAGKPGFLFLLLSTT